MEKKFRLVCILSLVLAGIAIAWNTLTNYFRGVGINYVAVLAVFSIVFIMAIENYTLRKQTKDLFIVNLVIVGIETIIFAMQEYFGRFGKVMYIFYVIQCLLSVFAILYFVYIILKMLFTSQGRLGGVFHCLFHSNKEKKPKKAKELSNGSLEDKPQNSEDAVPVLEGQVEIDNEFEE